jgi:hypothetical protein
MAFLKPFMFGPQHGHGKGTLDLWFGLCKPYHIFSWNPPYIWVSNPNLHVSLLRGWSLPLLHIDVFHCHIPHILISAVHHSVACVPCLLWGYKSGRHYMIQFKALTVWILFLVNIIIYLSLLYLDALNIISTNFVLYNISF